MSSGTVGADTGYMNARRLRWLVLAVAAAIVLPVFALVEGESVDARGLAALLFTTFWLAPFLLYVRDIRTTIGSIGVGVALLVATVVGVTPSIRTTARRLRSDSSRSRCCSARSSSAHHSGSAWSSASLPRSRCRARRLGREVQPATIVAASAIRWSFVHGGPIVARGPSRTSSARSASKPAAWPSTSLAS